MPPNEKGRPGQEAPSQNQIEHAEHNGGPLPRQAAAVRDKLIEAGVPPDLDADIRGAPIVPRVDDGFDFAEDGPLAVLVPTDPDNPSDDCIAFFVGEPHRWWSRSAAPILNPAAIEHAHWFHTPLRLHATPLDYLKAGATGAVIIDWRENLRWWLGGVGAIECPSLEYQNRLAYVLRQPPLPRLLLTETTRRAA